MKLATLALTATLLSLTGCGVSTNAGSGSSSNDATTRPIVLTTAERAIPEKYCPAAEHPAELTLGCQMGWKVKNLHWMNWGEPVSYAEGQPWSPTANQTASRERCAHSRSS